MGIQLNGTSGTDVISAVDESLTVEGLTISGNFNIADKIIHSGDTNTAIRFPADDTISFETSGYERLRITSGGYLQLQGGHVYGDDSATATLRLQNTSGNNNHSRIEIGAIQNSDNGGIHFYTAGSSTSTRYMTLKGGGNLGIGIDNPTSRLYVNGVSTSDIITARAADTNGASVINILAEGTTGISRIKFSDTAAPTGDGWISYYHSLRAITFSTAGVGNERMRIASNGFVGINTNDPAAPLHVQKKGGTIAVFGNDDGSSGAQYECLSITNGTQSYPAIENASSSDTLELRSAGSVQATIDYNNNDTNKYFRVVANNVGGSGSEVFRVDEEGQISGIAPGDTHTGVINNCDVALGSQYTWNQIESTNNVTNTAANHFKIAFYRSTSGNYTTCYYRGVVVDVFASGKLDWSGHGFVTHYSKSLLTFSSTTTGRYHDLGINKGWSYLQNSSSNMTLDTVDWSHDSDYLYATFKFQSNEGGSGWNPYYTVTITDNTGIVQSVTGI